MAAKFKNVITEVDTTGSPQALLTCPAGKTIIIRTFYIRNNNNADSTHYVAIKDNSEDSSNSFPIFDFALDVSASTTAVNINPIVLEENDIFLFQTSQANQHITLAYVELDTGVTQRYKMFCASLADGVTTAAVTCPTGSTVIINYISFFNNSGGSVDNNNISITDAGIKTNMLFFGTLADQAGYSLHQSLVLESGDILTCLARDSDMIFYVSYLEIRNPPIRA